MFGVRVGKQSASQSPLAPLHPPSPLLQVNATGVMPVIFSSSLLALPASLARYTNSAAVEGAAAALSPSGSLYLPANVAFIVAFNYLYTFLQVPAHAPTFSSRFCLLTARSGNSVGMHVIICCCRRCCAAAADAT